MKKTLDCNRTECNRNKAMKCMCLSCTWFKGKECPFFREGDTEEFEVYLQKAIMEYEGPNKEKHNG